MREVCSEIEIKGSAKRVWKVLTSFSGYPIWNPFMRIAGELKVGARPQITILQPGNKNLTYRPKITAVESNQELRWSERGRIPFILDSERVFRLELVSAKEVKVVQCQRFRGILTPFIGKILQNLEQLFKAFNIALKAQVERG